ncbi:hypothetical protein BCY86_05485 [Pajaroellobacter abortibovis]|uniref:Uncharacterized protein n=1 Tax=Pajaroellobacter abortibovis TaxID=1882918 RepID=A0A1L6MXI4_9BACT|nr:hypothetical protein BCY86_05485 [Pajaroellobacter abortibovis]
MDRLLKQINLFMDRWAATVRAYWDGNKPKELSLHISNSHAWNIHIACKSDSGDGGGQCLRVRS